MRSLAALAAFIFSAISSAALLLWMVMMPADIAAVLVVFVATVIIQFGVAIYIRMSRTGTATKREPNTRAGVRRVLAPLRVGRFFR